MPLAVEKGRKKYTFVNQTIDEMITNILKVKAPFKQLSCHIYKMNRMLMPHSLNPKAQSILGPTLLATVTDLCTRKLSELPEPLNQTSIDFVGSTLDDPARLEGVGVYHPSICVYCL